jgi:RNA polymerase sigma factor (sigma-70 family)
VVRRAPTGLSWTFKENYVLSESNVQRVTRIFNEHEAAIRAIAKHYARCEPEVDDICQDIFLSMVQCPPSDETSLLAYLNTVVRNHARDAARRSASRRRFTETYTGPTGNAAEPDSPDDQVDRGEQAEKAKMFIEYLLPPYMGRVILERYVHGRSVLEIASMLKIRTTSVSRYCSVGLQRLRHFMDGPDDHT